jgi:hypothetical protein
VYDSNSSVNYSVQKKAIMIERVPIPVVLHRRSKSGKYTHLVEQLLEAAHAGEAVRISIDDFPALVRGAAVQCTLGTYVVLKNTWRSELEWQARSIGLSG